MKENLARKGLINSFPFPDLSEPWIQQIILQAMWN